MRSIFLIVMLALVASAMADERPAWLPEHYTIPIRTVSPDGQYGVMIPDAEGGGPSKLIEMRSGRGVATIIGAYGWESGTGHSMRWGEMKPVWSKDSSTLCWIYPNKWFPRTFVALKVRHGKLAWQLDLMKSAQREILARTEEAAPRNFAAVKLENAEDGSAYPEGFSIDIPVPNQGFDLPLVCNASLTSNPKESEETPERNGVRSWLKMTIDADGNLEFSNFRCKRGALSSDTMKKVKAARVTSPLIDTSAGKALLFPGMHSTDGRYAMGWTVRPAGPGHKPVDWSRWDPEDPDKLLRNYDWQSYFDEDHSPRPFHALNFVLDRRTGEMATLAMRSPYFPGKRDGWGMVAAWCSTPDGSRYALVANQSGLALENFWLVTLGEKRLAAKELTAAMKTAVIGVMRERRPELATPEDYLISCQRKDGDRGQPALLASIPFATEACSSDEREFGLKGVITLRLSDATVVGASSEAKRLDPFKDNEELKNADEKLNAVYQGALKSLSRENAEQLKQKQQEWILKRDRDAAQAVNVTPYDSPLEMFEKEREKSLLASTKKRILELEKKIGGTTQ